MRKLSIVAFMILILSISACGSSKLLSTTLTTLPTNTLISTNTPTSTNTITPTYTPIPTGTATPVPLGGEGTFVMGTSPHLVPKWFNSQEPFIWYSASSDGSNIKLLDGQIWSISPDGKRALTYTTNNNSDQNVVSLTNLDGAGTILLDNSIDYFICNETTDCHETTAMWLPNGDVMLLGYVKNQHSQISIYIVSPDGLLKKWEKPSLTMKNFADLLFVTPDGKKLIWQNYTCANSFCTTSGYYISSLDDSEQEHILPIIFAKQDTYLSPSGQYITYSDYSGGTFRGCYIYKIADGTSTKIPQVSNIPMDFCNNLGTGSHWSPTEDKLWGPTMNGYSIYSVSDGTMNEIATFSDIGYCFPRWTPDGKYLFLNDCTDTKTKFSDLENMKFFFKSFSDLTFNESLGQGLIDISSGKITKFPDTGFCDNVISSDSQWALIYACKNEKDLVVYPSQLLNLNTKVMVPIFNDFVADSNLNISQTSGAIIHNTVWSVFWTPQKN